MNVETLTVKFENKEITREDFVAQLNKLTLNPKSQVQSDDAYQFVLDALNVHNDPDPRIFVDLLALFVSKIKDQTGYVANPGAFERFNLQTLDDVMGVLSALRKGEVLFPTKKRSKNKLTFREKTGLDINEYFREYLLTIFDETKVVLGADEF